MSRTPLAALVAGLLVAGCNTGSRDEPNAATAPAASQPPSSVNVLAVSSASPTGSTATGGGAALAVPSSGGSSAATTSAPATSAPATSAPATSAPATSAPATSAPAASAPAASAQAQLWGTVPPDPTTGFDGTLYLVGEKLVPGSIISVEVNGVWTKFLPATFHSSELLGVAVYLTVPADYTFTALAPDGSQSTPLQLTAPNGGAQAVLGLTPPELHMVYPPALDTNFSGTLWLSGTQFMPGSVALVSVAGLPAVPLPLQFVNERTVGLVTATPFAGDITIQVSNPTFLGSQAVTVTVGPAPATAMRHGAQAPSFSAPASVASPFVGTVHLTGSDLQTGAVAELRSPGGPLLLATPLIRVSSQEAWWTLAYPARGDYEVRVVNPGGAASPWAAFRVD